LKGKILAETEDYIISTSSYGCIIKYWKGEGRYSTPQHIDFPVKSEAEWFEYKKRLVASEEKLLSGVEKTIDFVQKSSGFIFLSQREPCWPILCDVMGFSRGLATMYKNPELFDDMLKTFTIQLIEMCKIIEEKGMDYDGVYLRGDLCYKNGMLFSPRIYDSLLYRYHKRICDFFKKRSKPVVHHCDGNVTQYIPLIVKAGFTGIEPLEARAGNDVRELKKKWNGKIALLGNISVEALSSTKREIENEVLSKLPVAKEGGGYVFKSDHSVPPTVSLENYSYAVELAKKHGKY
jgi:uroporphyrinogen decarboxylase